ncbi:hypothetical protein E1B28_005520 [Marasmius oreades]|uniref:HNH nuclease domain-containing protein n=1 Tax=Marasmius oreades TaxID=181124 RepID=A0A9P7S4Q1_9AGAR|nr:uncharacterized protein E1B28_005520 [Marasmius oreades]KAG7094701.1 hypothetical protein E1B28_005520 [Marasmius oreades]
MASTSTLAVCSPLPEIPTPIPPQHVRLVVWRHGSNMLALDLPVEFVYSVVNLKPLKYLAYAAWSICGQWGELRDGQGKEVDMDQLSLYEFWSYQYFTPQDVPFTKTVNHALTKQHTKVGTSHGPKHSSVWATQVKDRDGGCIFTGVTPPGPSIVADFVENIKTHEVGDLSDINDIRNGITLSSSLCTEYDAHKFAILPIPNDILSAVEMKEADPNHPRERRRVALFPTTGQRRLQRTAYILHWMNPWKFESEAWRENMDDMVTHCAQAGFVQQVEGSLPHQGLLHYRYGTSLIINFMNATVSRGWDLLQKKRDHDEPPEEEEGPPAQISYSSAREEKALVIQSWFDSLHEVSKSFRKVEEWRNMAQT